MAQFEYNDLNKFFVSIGVFLVGIAFVIPWMFLREPFDLLVRAEDLKKLTPTAQSIIQKRQVVVGAFSLVIPLVSLICLLLGGLLCFKGIRGWRPLQSLLEKREQLTNEKLTREIVQLSKDEKLVRVERDVSEQIKAEDVQPQSSTIAPDPKTYAQKYLATEAAFFNKVSATFSRDYKVFRDFRLGNREFDILLRSPVPLEKDVILEVKFSEARIGGSYYEQLIAQLKDLLQSYQTSYKPNSVARLVLLMTNEAIHTKSSHPNAIYSRTKDLVEYQNRNLRGTDLHVALIDVDRLKDYPEIELRELLRLP